MIIYAETRQGFLEDVDLNRLERRLVEGFRHNTGSVPADRIVWADEYARFSSALRRARIDDDMQIAIEYHVSVAGRSRIDVLLAGNDGEHDNGVVIELKAWSEASASDVPELVWSPYGGGRLAQHPCLQANKYKGMILRFNADIRDKGIGIHSAAYLFNLARRRPEPLEDPRYRHILDESRLFLADDADELSRYLERTVRHRSRQDIFFLLEKGRIIPAPGLIERVRQMLDGNAEFDLIDAQNEAFQVIRHAIAGVATAAKRQVFIVHGGPGTGKSIIAVRLLAEVLASRRLGFFVAPNKAFRDTLVEQLSRGGRDYRADGQALLQSSWSFHAADYTKDHLHEVLIIDEAHRLKDQAYQYRGSSMVEDMVRAARISVFFLDESQRVQWADSGSEDRIRQAAKTFDARVHEPFRLAAQFRCGGSDGYLNWLDDVLQIRPTGNFDNWAESQYDFRVFEDAAELYRELEARNDGNKARLVAGYSWDWPTKGRQRAAGLQHVTVAGLSLPWNFSGENWATASDGIGQVGCVHTCQGVEFDWLGVLVGPDLRFEDGRVVGDPSRRARTDSSLNGWKVALRRARGDAQATAAVVDKVQSIIKNTYKVLLSRGRRGCFVWFADPGLRDYFRERLGLAYRTLPRQLGTSTTGSGVPVPSAGIVADPPGRRYEEWLPVFDLCVAAGGFGPSSTADCLGWVATPPGIRGDERFFAAWVNGRSMEPLIPNGSLCLFRTDVVGGRSGRILLVQHHAISDPELGGSYTVKKYRSLKVQDVEAGENDSWTHAAIQLTPVNNEFSAIWINPDQVEELRIVAEFIRVLA